MERTDHVLDHRLLFRSCLEVGFSPVVRRLVVVCEELSEEVEAIVAVFSRGSK